MLTEFRARANEWICDGCAIEIRGVAGLAPSGRRIWNASVVVTPHSTPTNNAFEMTCDPIYARQLYMTGVSRTDALALVERVCAGRLDELNAHLAIQDGRQLSYYSQAREMHTWFADLNLTVSGSVRDSLSPAAATELDDALRCSTLPFDGLVDLYAWLDLGGTVSNGTLISIRVLPPVDISYQRSRFSDGRFAVVLLAQPSFDVAGVGLAVRGMPGGVALRRQAAADIAWGDLEDGWRVGTATVELPDAVSAFVALTLNGRTIRRQWFQDPLRSKNIRLLALRQFDEDLEGLKRAVFSRKDGDSFEKAVGSLLYMLGFTPVHPTEPDGPDLIASTGEGRLILVECTIKVPDLSTKMGKLVERRNALLRTLTQNRQIDDVTALLVTRQSRADVATIGAAPVDVYLLCHEELDELFGRLEFAPNPDVLLREWKRGQSAQTRAPA